MGQLGLVAAAVVFLLAATPAMAQIPLTGQTGQTAAPSTQSSSTQKTLSEPEAKRKLEKSGYKEVTDLKRDGGTWKASAKKNGKNVSVSISRTGKVSETKRPVQSSAKTTSN